MVGLCGTLLGLGLAFLLPWARPRAGGGNNATASATQAMRAGWRERNVSALMGLSAVGRLSVQEQRRFDRAGDDPESMRRALIGIHEDRLADASLDLQDAQRRKIQLQGSSGYKVYANQPPPRDLVQLANEDEWAATSKIALYAGGLSRIKAWQPVSYPSYAASLPVGAPVPVSAPARASARRPKPDPRVPMSPGRPPAEQTQTAAVQPPAARSAVAPSDDDLAEAARHPSVTVYPDHEPSAEPSGHADLGERVLAEQAIQQTLRQWSSAMVLNNPQAEAAAYAPLMSRYFLRKNVDHAFVEADKAAYLRHGNRTARFALEDVAIENETADAADVRLVKDVTWERRMEGPTHQLIRSRLHLERTGEGWKISGEQDFR